jgi:hypothetical protein
MLACVVAKGVESKHPLDGDLASLIYTETISIVLDLRLVYPTATRLIARGSQTMFAMPSQLGSLGDAAGSFNPTNLIRAPCRLLLASNLAALTLHPETYTMFREILREPTPPNSIGSTAGWR